MKRSAFLTILFISASGLFVGAQQPQTTPVEGKIVFEKNCVRCHGSDGTLGKFGAKNLHKSKLNLEETVRIISNGKWIMPRWKKKLSMEQILSVATYVKTLR